MKAIVYHQYGPPGVVALAEVPKPTARDHEVLIRILATTVTTGDFRARSLSLPPGFGLLGRLVFGVFGPRKPILGTELAGEIEAVGKAVTRFKAGDQVFAFPGASFGCHAEYRTMAEDGLIALKPTNLSFEEAAALSFGGTTALRFLRDKAGVKPGDRVLVVGASGGVGTAAVQIAKHLGAEVTGGLQHSQSRARALDRRGQRHRLHAGSAPPPRLERPRLHISRGLSRRRRRWSLVRRKCAAADRSPAPGSPGSLRCPIRLAAFSPVGAATAPILTVELTGAST